MCGKTLDIHWLLSNGYRVAGAELSQLAIQQLFAELGVEPTISRVGDIDHYAAEDIDIYVGDIFHLTPGMLGPVHAIYDRAALVALPETMRHRYAAHLVEITDKAPRLLVRFEYDQNLHAGPPFSIDSAECPSTLRTNLQPDHLASTDVPGGQQKRVSGCSEKPEMPYELRASRWRWVGWPAN
ncbi:thiopurine S-methyltransferase [Aromatoleum bremense]|uniref:thiopurine S-methyltransferase n=1 Tax=Aromatoleum bremense TaxID=76115 RepID=UPI001BB69EA0|nr:thiopurine S-methyltransferase [Aromatoleum bremense]QTQ31875.1 Thiopurine S-methyltransferase [Aromatoleum bremense]